MAGRFDPVRDSVESVASGDPRRSVSAEAGHRKNARSASIADMLNNDSASRTSSAASSHAQAPSYGGHYSHAEPSSRPSSPGFAAVPPRRSHHESPSMLSRDSAREEDPRYLSPHERPVLHHKHSSGSLSSGRHHSPPVHTHHGAGQAMPRDMRSERSPSLLHILNSNAHLDDSHRRASSSSSIHSLGAPYVSNNSPDAEYHARMQSQPHAYGSEAHSARYSSHGGSQRNALHTVRQSSSMGSVAEFAVPEVPNRSPESMRGRTSLPQTGPHLSPGHSHYAAGHSYPSGQQEMVEVDGHGRPVALIPGQPRSPGSLPNPHYASNAIHHLPPAMHNRGQPPLHIETAAPYPAHMQYPQSPSQPPQTPYSTAVQSPHRFPPTPGAFALTPGEYMGPPPVYHTPRQHSIADAHGLGVPTMLRNGNRSPSQQRQWVAQGQFEEGERQRSMGHDGYYEGHDGRIAMHEDESRRLEYLHRERQHQEELERAHHERREWEEREALAHRERYEMEAMRAREWEEQEMMRARAEEEAAAAAHRRMEAEKAAEAQKKSSPPAPPAKKRKEKGAKPAERELIKKETVNSSDASDKIIRKEVKEKPKADEALKASDVSIEEDTKDRMAPPESENGVEDLTSITNGAVEKKRLPYQPQVRVSVPTTIRVPFTSAELGRMRYQSRNPLRQRWEDANPGHSDGWQELIAEFEAHQIQAKARSLADAAGGAKKRKRLTDGNMTGSNSNGDPNSKLVAEHYNSRQDIGVGQRKQSPIIELRNYNNWVKSVLIQRFGRRGGRALELGGGKGGDLNKWDRLRIKHFVLADIAEVSVTQARSRFSERRFSYTADFVAGDCFGAPLADWMPRQVLEPMFDNLSLQFCLHYGWETPALAQQMMENVARYLRPGGTFIGTMPDCHTLHRRLQAAVDEDGSSKSFGNRFYNVTFDQVEVDADRRVRFQPYGQKYTFSLLDAVDSVAEYVVDWEHFDSLAMQNGLQCVYRKTFEELWQDEGRPARSAMRDLALRMTTRPDSDVPIEPALWEATTVYVAFAFEKVRQ